jgi:multidrug/hemolysin transport system permease protein
MIMMLNRNLKQYFRDRAAVFFSVLSVIIVFALYVFFLGDTMMGGSLQKAEGAKFLMDSWIMAGILAITGMSTTMGVLGIMVEDNARKISKDFLTSPMKRSRLAGGYILSAFTIGVIMSIFTFMLAEIYIVTRGGELLSALNMLKVLGIILLSVASSSAMTFLLVSFFKSMNAFGTASTVVGTALGFLTGIYIPIGSLNSTIRFLIKIFPVSYSGSLFRKIMMQQAISKTFASAPAGTADSFERNMGVVYQFGNMTVSTATSICILIATTVLFYGLAIVKLSRKKES